MHLMTGHKGNSEFRFPETLNVPRGEAEGNTGVKNRKISEKNDLLDAIAFTGCTRKVERPPKPTCPIETSR